MPSIPRYLMMPLYIDLHIHASFSLWLSCRMYEHVARSFKREKRKCQRRSVRMQDRKTSAGKLGSSPPTTRSRAFVFLRRSLLSMRRAAASKDRNARFINLGQARLGCDLYPISPRWIPSLPSKIHSNYVR